MALSYDDWINSMQMRVRPLLSCYYGPDYYGGNPSTPTCNFCKTKLVHIPQGSIIPDYKKGTRVYGYRPYHLTCSNPACLKEAYTRVHLWEVMKDMLK